MTYFNELSDREHEVLELIVEGLSNIQIGQKRYLSPNTVKTYVKGIMNKLVVSDDPLGRSLIIASKLQAPSLVVCFIKCQTHQDVFVGAR